MAYTGKYKTPAELMSDGSLSNDEKIEMLEQWRDDKEALMRASDEGMHGNFRSDLFSEIQNALALLKEGSPPKS